MAGLGLKEVSRHGTGVREPLDLPQHAESRTLPTNDVRKYSESSMYEARDVVSYIAM